MHRIVAFFLKQYPFFLFLLLEIVAISLVINHNNYHKGVLRLGVSEVSGTTYEIWSHITGYFSLHQQNRALAEENARLRSQMPDAFKASDRKVFVRDDTVYQQQFEYVSARVVKSSVNRQRNILMIDKGVNQGIAQNMGVMGSDGIVGVVQSVSANYALVLPVINVGANIFARLKSNDQKGIVSWNGASYHYAQMKGIPGHILVEQGDTIITSGQSVFFPEGLCVGFVTDYVQSPGDNFYTIRLRLGVDFNSLNHVYVIRNLMADEQHNLLKENGDAE